MPRTRASHKSRKVRPLTVKVDSDCLELDAETAEQCEQLRLLMGRVNSSADPQPYVIESPPGCFRLYVGDAAERVRTARGMQP